MKPRMKLRRTGGVVMESCTQAVSDTCEAPKGKIAPIQTFWDVDRDRQESICRPCLDKLIADGEVTIEA